MSEVETITVYRNNKPWVINKSKEAIAEVAKRGWKTTKPKPKTKVKPEEIE